MRLVPIGLLCLSCAGAQAVPTAEATRSCLPHHAVRAGGLELEYESFGDEHAPAILLIMGIGSQMIAWPDGFCRMLAARGFHVIRFDNRDVGLSSKIESAGTPDLAAAFKALVARKPVPTAYRLTDMADDAVGLLDALGIAKAHLVGVSMGGMIAQEIAIHHPERVLTLTSMSSTTGDPSLPPGSPLAATALLQRPPADRDGFIAYVESIYRVIGSPDWPTDPRMIAELAGRSWDRCYYPVGGARQLTAIWAAKSRREALSKLQIPVLVIHGKADPLIPVAHGIDTAKSVPGAQLELIEGMGHDLPPGLWPRITEAIAKLAESHSG